MSNKRIWTSSLTKGSQLFGNLWLSSDKAEKQENIKVFGRSSNIKQKWFDE